MTFQITLSRPPAAASFEVGSIAEAVAVLQQEESALLSLFKVADGLNGPSEPAAPEAPGGVESGTAESNGSKPARRGRAPKEAVAPAPIPVPSAAPAAPVAPAAPTPPVAPPNLQEGANGIPAFLDRSLQTPTPPAPPPLLPNAPALAPPPTGVLAAKVVAELERRAKGAPDQGKALADWLAACGLTVPGMSYGDALAAVAFISDDKLATVAGQLGVS